MSKEENKNENESEPTHDLEALVELLLLNRALQEHEIDVILNDHEIPELTEEQMNELLAKVRENFGDNT